WRWAVPPVSDPATDAGEPGAHPPLPPVGAHSGKILSQVKLVTITAPGYALRSQVEAFGDYIVTAPWLDAAGGEYGVQHGTHLAKVQLTQALPATMSDMQIPVLIQQQIIAASLPPPD